MKEFNINNYIYVELTKLGEEILGDEIEDYPDEKGTNKRRFQLWDFMNIFGTYFGETKENVIVDCKMYFDEEDFNEAD